MTYGAAEKVSKNDHPGVLRGDACGFFKRKTGGHIFRLWCPILHFNMSHKIYNLFVQCLFIFLSTFQFSQVVQDTD